MSSRALIAQLSGQMDNIIGELSSASATTDQLLSDNEDALSLQDNLSNLVTQFNKPSQLLPKLLYLETQQEEVIQQLQLMEQQFKNEVGESELVVEWNDT